jgi:hypothetical protein
MTGKLFSKDHAKRPLAVIVRDDAGKYRVSTDCTLWVDAWDDESEAETFALREGYRVEGC